MVKSHSWADIEKEFDESLGYVRQDIGWLREHDSGLNYTVALLICCACDMLAWHRDVPDHQVFTSLLPDDESYRAIGKSMFEALRNGLAHRFRPDTIKIGVDQFRFTLSWKGRTHLGVINGDPPWLVLNVKVLEESVIAQIDEYQEELKRSETARIAFQEHFKNCVKEIPEAAERVARGWRSVFRRE